MPTEPLATPELMHSIFPWRPPLQPSTLTQVPLSLWRLLLTAPKHWQFLSPPASHDVLQQWFSTCGSWTSSVSISWKLEEMKSLGSITGLRNQELLGRGPATCVWMSPPGASDSHSNSRIIYANFCHNMSHTVLPQLESPPWLLAKLFFSCVLTFLICKNGHDHITLQKWLRIKNNKYKVGDTVPQVLIYYWPLPINP